MNDTNRTKFQENRMRRQEVLWTHDVQTHEHVVTWTDGRTHEAANILQTVESDVKKRIHTSL